MLTVLVGLVMSTVVALSSGVGASSGPSTTVPVATTVVSDEPDVIEIGTSVQGRPITVERRGQAGARKVLVIGVIHGDEQAGLQIVDVLRSTPVPDGVDLYLMDTMNPDGMAADRRGNANGVDLNRNFAYDWAPLGQPGDPQWAGPAAASEPETQAVMAYLDALQPDLVIWYHQDLFRISPSRGRDGAIRARYAELTGIPLLTITGGTNTGVAATWARHNLDAGVAFIVELADTLTPADAERYGDAVLTVASEDD